MRVHKPGLQEVNFVFDIMRRVRGLNHHVAMDIRGAGSFGLAGVEASNLGVDQISEERPVALDCQFGITEFALLQRKHPGVGLAGRRAVFEKGLESAHWIFT